MEIDSLIEQGTTYRQRPLSEFNGEPSWIAKEFREDFFQWRMKVLTYLQARYGNNLMVKKFDELIQEDKHEAHLACLDSLIGILNGLREVNPQKEREEDSETILETIFENFHRFAKQLKKRHEGRSSIEIKDEYDVQDLLHALLRLHFDDVRPEEWVPSYAGGCKRMDFLLKDSKIAIEVKMTRKGLKDKDRGEQLTIDIANYKQHPGVDTLYCFVYDKEELIYNAIGVEKDLEKLSTNDFRVKVFIRPN